MKMIACKTCETSGGHFVETFLIAEKITHFKLYSESKIIVGLEGGKELYLAISLKAFFETLSSPLLSATMPWESQK